MSEIIYISREEVENSLAEKDMDSYDSSSIYDIFLWGCSGYKNMGAEELLGYYNEANYDEDFEYRYEEDRKKTQEWNDDSNE